MYRFLEDTEDMDNRFDRERDNVDHTPATEYAQFPRFADATPVGEHLIDQLYQPGHAFGAQWLLRTGSDERLIFKMGSRRVEDGATVERPQSLYVVARRLRQPNCMPHLGLSGPVHAMLSP